MARKKLLISIVILMLLIFLMYKGANKFYWYNSIWYFDMIMHFLSGFWVGLFFLYVYFPDKVVFKSILYSILFVLFIGISWEVFEFFVFNVIGKIPFDSIDTASDVFWDIAGGFASTLFFFKRIIPFKESKVQ